MPEESPLKTKKKPGLVRRFLTVIIPVLLGVGIAAFVVRQQPQLLGLSQGPEQIQAEADALVAEVGKLISLPSDEKPTVATITDIDKLKEQNFFKNGANDDKVIIYTNARKAILYRPSERRIIEVGAVNINQTAPTPTPEVSPAPEASPSPTAQ